MGSDLSVPDHCLSCYLTVIIVFVKINNAKIRFLHTRQGFFAIFTSADKPYLTYPYPTRPWDR